IGHHPAIAAIAAEFAGGAAVGWLLVRRQLSQAMPLLPVDLFARPIFTLSVTTSVCSFVAQGIAFVALPFYFHDVIGASAVETGLLITPWAVMTAILAPIAGYLADRHPAGILGAIDLDPDRLCDLQPRTVGRECFDAEPLSQREASPIPERKSGGSRRRDHHAGGVRQFLIHRKPGQGQFAKTLPDLLFGRAASCIKA